MKHLISFIAFFLFSLHSMLAQEVTTDVSSIPYNLRLTTQQGEYYLNIVNGAAYISEQPQDLLLIEQEDGSFGIADTERNYLIYKGIDRWTMTTDTEPYNWTLAAMPDGGYSITGVNGLLGTNDYDGNTPGSPIYGDKTVENGNVVWSITPANIAGQREEETELPTITVAYHGEHIAFVDIPSSISDVTYSLDNANVTLMSNTTTREYAYQISGKTGDGSLTLVGNYKLTLQLNGVEITNSDGPAIDVECGKRIAVELVDGTVNRLIDGANGTHKAALYFSGHPEFEGRGALSVKGNSKHAISAKEYLQLKKSVGTINVLGAVSDGIHCGKGKVANEHNYFEMRGGIVNINNVGSDGIDSDDFGVIRLSGGTLNVNLTGDDADGLKADSILQITGGSINMTVAGNKSNAIRSNYYATLSGGNINVVLTGDGSKALKTKNANTTVLNGGILYITGGEIEVYALGDNFYEPDDTTKCMGISTDLDLNQTGGDVLIYALGPDAKGYNVKRTERKRAGTFQVVKAPWKLNPYSFQYDMSSYVVVKMDEEMVNDYSNLAVAAFIADECVGGALFSNNNFGELRIRANSTEPDSISFCLYDYEKELEINLTADRDVIFTPNECYGYPGSPVVLGGQYPEERLRGDVNLDGLVNINDVVAIINVMAGDDIFFNTADVNEDGNRDINDVVAVINIMAGAQ